MSACGKEDTSNKGDSGSDAIQRQEETVSESSKQREIEEDKPTITKAEFDSIEEGMTYEEVVAIIGGEGELQAESGTPGDQFHTVLYIWEGDSTGSAANAMFQGGRLTSKAQYGLD